MTKITSLQISVLLLSLLLSALRAGAGELPAGSEEPQPYNLSITGNAYFSEKELLKFAASELQKFSQRGQRKADIDDAAFQMRASYLQAGFAFANVDYDYEQKADQLQVAFKVEEGPRVFIERISFTGNRGILTEKLLDFFPQPPGPLARQGKMIFNESAVRDAVNRISDYYRGEGFKDVAVKGPEFFFTGKRSGVNVTIGIDEGARYLINAVVLRGDLRPELAAELEKIKKDLAGKTFYLRRKLLLRSSLAEVYDAGGYAAAEFEVTVVPVAEAGRVNLVAEITGGEQVRIKEVVISGNEKTRASFIRERLQLKPGDIYSRAKRRESFRRLYDSGLFAKINIDLAPRQEDGSRNLEVAVEELPGWEIYLEPGWGSYEEQRLGAGVFEKNLFGTGRNGRVEGLVSTKGGNLTLSYTDPWLLQTEIAMNVPVYYERREEPAYTSEETGLALFFSKQFSKSLTLSSGYQFKMTELINLTDATLMEKEEGDYNQGTLSFQATGDTRNDVFYPDTGFRLVGGFDLSLPAFGSEIQFGRLTMGGRYFMELPREYVLGLRLRTGLILPLRDQTFIPISERFFNGGDSTVRSYKHSRLGPKDDSNEPLGGLGYNVFSIEVRKRLYRNFAATFYVDAGNVSPNRSLPGNDFTLYDSGSELFDDTLNDFFSEFKFGIGLGLQYLLPVGPIRIDIAYNPDPEEVWAEDEWVFHFSLGMAF